MDDRPLHVVGPKWMSADLGRVHDYGFDVPDRPTDFWCSGAHYASIGVRDQLLNTGWDPAWGPGPEYDIAHLTCGHHIVATIT